MENLMEWARYCSIVTIYLPLMVFCWLPLKAVAEDSRPQFIAQEVDIHFKGERNILDEVAKTIRSPEFKAIASAVAPELHVPSYAIGIAQIALSGVKDGRDDHNGRFDAPDGYTTCRVEMVSYKPAFQAGPSDVRFNMNVSRTCQKQGPVEAKDGPGYYIVTPKAWAGTIVSARVRLVYVLADPPEVVRLTNAGVCPATHDTCA
jgi:hypothetical protein